MVTETGSGSCAMAGFGKTRSCVKLAELATRGRDEKITKKFGGTIRKKEICLT
jgi:hypothetical protein